MADPTPPSNVVRFPVKQQLVARPPPPRLGPDARQTRVRGIVENLSRELGDRGVQVEGGTNFDTGFHAANVNVGELQTALARSLARFDMREVEARWEELLPWLHAVLGAWVQRLKVAKLERRETGVHVELQTQDDHGYYTYGFDVFPGRRAD